MEYGKAYEEEGDQDEHRSNIYLRVWIGSKRYDQIKRAAKRRIYLYGTFATHRREGNNA